MRTVSSGVLPGRACFVKETNAGFRLAYGAGVCQKAGSRVWGLHVLVPGSSLAPWPPCFVVPAGPDTMS